MKMHVVFAAAALAAGALLGSSVAQATTYDLSADISTANQPGSAWSIVYSGGTLPTQSAVGSNGNHLESAIPGSYFGTGTNLNNDTPFVFRTAKDGSELSGLNDGDFLAGDILVHTPNDGSIVSIVWQAPTAGVINNFVFDGWYAHSSVDRSNTVTFSFGAVTDSFKTSKLLNPERDNGGGATGTAVPVNAGDLLTLSFMKTPGQTYGSLSGMNVSFDFSPVPIPATLPLFAAGLAGLGWIARRKRQAAA